MLKKTDLIISIVGTNGLTNIIDYSLDNVNLTENCAKITNLKEGYNIEFSYYYLNSNVGQLIQEATVGAVQKKLPIKNIRSLKIPFPNTDIQNKIVRILSTIDDKIEINEKKKIYPINMPYSLDKKIMKEHPFPDELESLVYSFTENRMLLDYKSYFIIYFNSYFISPSFKFNIL